MMGMGMGMSQTMGHYQRQEQRLELSAPHPEDAVTGIEGLRVADELLKSKGLVGMLLGGLAKELWLGNKDEDALAEHKDVDVLVLSYDQALHPERWESGIDWWVSHNSRERPTNGTSVGIYWRVQLESHALRIPRGLYLCPVELLRASVILERQLIKDRQISGGRFKSDPVPLYPVLHELQLSADWAGKHHPVAKYSGE